MNAAPDRTTQTSTASGNPWLGATLDVGGTKIAAGLVDHRGQLLFTKQVPTPSDRSDTETFHAVRSLLDALADHPAWPEVQWVGVGSAGPINLRDGTISPVNIPAWRGFPIVDMVQAHDALSDRPVVLSGDGVAMAAAEHWIGAARGFRNALCLVVSTGVGAGIILDGAIRQGSSGNAGHLGHITVDLDGPPCPCGSRGCLERLASGPAILRTARDHGWQSAGGPATAVQVAADASLGDPAAVAAFDRAAQALAAGIAATAALVDLDVAVIGGGVAEAGDLLLTPLRQHLHNYATLAFTNDITVKPAALRTDAGLIGAAVIAAHRFRML